MEEEKGFLSFWVRNEGNHNEYNDHTRTEPFFWGVGRIYQYGAAVMETSWNRVSVKKKRGIDRALGRLSRRIEKRQGHVRPGLKTRVFFTVMSLAQKHGWNRADAEYWREKGWTRGVRPWKK